jgi:hypothetical protein
MVDIDRVDLDLALGAIRAATGAAAGVWWTTGDFAAHEGCRVEPLIDGHAAMLSMCMAFLGAKRSILLAAWDIRAKTTYPLLQETSALTIQASNKARTPTIVYISKRHRTNHTCEKSNA